MLPQLTHWPEQSPPSVRRLLTLGFSSKIKSILLPAAQAELKIVFAVCAYNKCPAVTVKKPVKSLTNTEVCLYGDQTPYSALVPSLRTSSANNQTVDVSASAAWSVWRASPQRYLHVFLTLSLDISSWSSPLIGRLIDALCIKLFLFPFSQLSILDYCHVVVEMLRNNRGNESRCSFKETVEGIWEWNDNNWIILNFAFYVQIWHIRNSSVA